jgi:flagellar hook assembly protein FlgD
MTETDLRAEGSPSDVTTADEAPSLLQVAARPNPFSTATRVEFSLPGAGTARIAVHDVRGRRVRTISDGVMTAGSHEVFWNGADDAGRRLPHGVYWITLTSAGRESHQQVVFMEDSK